MSPTRSTRKALQSKLLQDDVSAMISDSRRIIGREADELARDIIVVVRERVLAELSSYARENIR